MIYKNIIITLILFVLCLESSSQKVGYETEKNKKYIVINAIEPTDAGYKEISDSFKLKAQNNKIGIGVGFILHCMGHSYEMNINKLNQHLEFSVKYNLPLVIQLDVEQWWQNRPDLWNWWDKNQKGYKPENVNNVEWTGWSADSAVKIGWRNWGRQLRVLPMPNLMSKEYRAAAHEELKKIVPAILAWWKGLPQNKKHLLLAVKVGWESAIGVNNWYYPNGNSLLHLPENKDPHYGLTLDSIPDRGVQPIGFNAVKTLGLANSGQLKDDHITKVVSVHLEDLSKLIFDAGFPREKIFTHCGGWSKNETLHRAAINKYSCPGWSFYDYATDPAKDKSVMNVLKMNKAPYWAAVEWLYMGKSSLPQWKTAIQKTMAVKKIKYMCIYNWNLIKNDANSIAAINQVISRSN